MVNIYTLGVPLSSLEILKGAMQQVYGELFTIKEIERTTLLRSVKNAINSPEVVLVLLDSESYNRGSTIITEGSDEKFYKYENEVSFIAELNNRFGLNIKKEMEELDVSSFREDYSNEYEVLLEKFEERETRIAELEGLLNQYNENSYKELELKNEEYQAELLSLKDQNTTRESKITALNETLKNLKEDFDVLRELLEDEKSKVLEKDDSITSLKDSVKSLTIELSKQKQIKEAVNSELTALKQSNAEQILVLEDVEKLKKTIEDQKSMIDDLELENTKIADIDIDDLKATKTTLDKQLKLYKNIVKEKDVKITQNELDIEELSSVISRLNNAIVGVRDELSDKVEEVTTLKSEKIELNNELLVFKDKLKEMDRLLGVEEESSQLKKRLSSLESSVFSKINNALINNTNITTRVYDGSSMLKRVQFAFAGSSDSCRGAYNCLKNEFARNPSTKFLLVDLSSEIFYDYILGVKDAKSCLDWYKKGGGVLNYTTETSLKNVKLLTPGSDYFESTFYLTVDWVKRVKELESSGYTVVVFCGNIHNIVSKILFNSFIQYSSIAIYNSGTVLNARNLSLTLLNQCGFADNKDLSICVYGDLQEEKRVIVNKYYSLIEQKCDLRYI
jgi:hypothetical protein